MFSSTLSSLASSSIYHFRLSSDSSASFTRQFRESTNCHKYSFLSTTVKNFVGFCTSQYWRKIKKIVVKEGQYKKTLPYKTTRVMPRPPLWTLSLPDQLESCLGSRRPGSISSSPGTANQTPTTQFIHPVHDHSIYPHPHNIICRCHLQCSAAIKAIDRLIT